MANKPQQAIELASAPMVAPRGLALGVALSARPRARSGRSQTVAGRRRQPEAQGRLFTILLHQSGSRRGHVLSSISSSLVLFVSCLGQEVATEVLAGCCLQALGPQAPARWELPHPERHLRRRAGDLLVVLGCHREVDPAAPPDWSSTRAGTCRLPRWPRAEPGTCRDQRVIAERRRVLAEARAQARAIVDHGDQGADRRRERSPARSGGYRPVGNRPPGPRLAEEGRRARDELLGRLDTLVASRCRARSRHPDRCRPAPRVDRRVDRTATGGGAG